MNYKHNIRSIEWDFDSSILESVQFFKVNKDNSYDPIQGYLLKQSIKYIYFFDKTKLPNKFQWVVKHEKGWYPADPYEAPLIWFPVYFNL